MSSLLGSSSKGGLSPEKSLKLAALILLVVEIFVIIVFGLCTKEEMMEEGFSQVYQMFTGILIMMLFGFGYLMTFMSKYGLGAVGFTMLITVLGKKIIYFTYTNTTEMFLSHTIRNPGGRIFQEPVP